MKLVTSNMGSTWWFTDEERAHWAFVCSCMPLDKLGFKEGNFIRRMDAKFRGTRGGHLTDPQWQWFQKIAAQWSHLIPDL